MSRFIDLYVEQAVIGGIMLAAGRAEGADMAIDAIEGLTEDHFTVMPHKLSLRSYKRLNEAGEKIDLLTLTSDLERTGALETAGGFAYLAECNKNTPSFANLTAYCEKLREMHLGRRMTLALQVGIQKLSEPSTEAITDIIGNIQTDISGIEHNADYGTEHITTGIDMSLDTIQAIISGDIWKHKTELGMSTIDSAFGGFNNTDFIVVGGRPGMGKTMFSTTVTETVGLKNKKPVLFFSLEMPVEQISERIAFHRARVSKEDLLSKQSGVMDGAWGKVGHCMKDFIDSPIYINDKPSLSVHQVRSEARRMSKKLGGLGVVIVDYLQKMRMSDPENMNRSVGEIATGLKNLAKELRCPVIALAQLNRKVEERANKRPVAADLRESGVIEQEADVIFMIYRDEKYNPTTDLKGITEIICVKSRHAPGAEKTYHFSSRYSGLDPVAFSHAEQQEIDNDYEC
ncbi:replicative DNA helicase [Citrobacter freundii]|uniref:replicative DNA helicase n=1 Tax=Citrobacter freundii TaxID=546 RepID=UPI0015EA5E9B|nr:replicative DNA helicase [Citrobacter freundii]QLX25137.1 replicative DNA helicase [Citrobacter freundii]